MKPICRNMILALAAAAVLVPQAEVTAAAPAAPQNKVQLKKIDWRPFQNAVRDALKAKDNQKFEAALKAVADQSADTQGRINTIIWSVNCKNDHAFAIAYFDNMLKGELSEQDKLAVLGGLLNAYRNQAVSAMRQKQPDEAAFFASLKKIEAMPENVKGKKNTLIAVVSCKPDFAVDYLKKMLKPDLPKQEQESIYGALLGIYVRQANEAAKKHDDKAFRAAVKNIEAVPADLRNRNRTLINAVCADPVYAAAYLPKMQVTEAEKQMLNEAIFNNRVALANYYAKTKDRANFDKTFKAIEALPADTKGRTMALAGLAKYLDNGQTRDYLEKLIGKSVDAGEKYALLNTLRATAPLNTRPYVFTDKDAYSFQKKCWQRQQVLVAADEKLDPKERKLKDRYPVTTASHAAAFAGNAFEFGDYKFAEELLNTWYKSVGDKDQACAAMRLKMALFKHDNAAVKAIGEQFVPEIREKLNDPKTTNYWVRRNLNRQLVYFAGLGALAEKADLKAFDKAVFNGRDFKPEDRYLMLSYASSEAFKANRQDICNVIVKEFRDNMFKAAPRLTFQVKYDPDCPKTADAWTRTPGYAWDKLDTRFKLYGTYYEDSHDTDIKRLMKDAKEPEIPADNRAGVQFLYDNEALHIFVRVNDPAASEVLEGKRNGPGMEMLFRAGKDVTYNTDYLLNTPDTEQTFPQDWQRPGLDYTLTMDFIHRDVAVTNDAVVIHYGIPFSAFFDKLPVNGREWTFGLQVWGKSALTLSCGVVHELARMGLLDFKFTPAQLTAIKRVIIRKSINRGLKAFDWKNKGRMPRLWQDEVIGDPAFYDAEVKPLQTMLQEADKLEKELKDADVDAFYDKYVQIGLKLEYIVAAKRAEYIRSSLLK